MKKRVCVLVQGCCMDADVKELYSLMTVEMVTHIYQKKYMIMALFFVFFQILNFYTPFNGMSEQNPANGFTLEINTIKVKNNAGQIAIQVLDEQKKVVKQEFATIANKRSVLIIKGLPKGKYAVQLFHDENKNGKMDFNFLGIPKEGYGFSNDARGFMSEPAFDKQLFTLDQDRAIQIRLSYF